MFWMWLSLVHTVAMIMRLETAVGHRSGKQTVRSWKPNSHGVWCPNDAAKTHDRLRSSVGSSHTAEDGRRIARGVNDQDATWHGFQPKPPAGNNGEEELCPVDTKRAASSPRVMTAARKVGARRLRLSRGITMDSGASNNVMPRRMVRNKTKIRESPGSKKGVMYVAANSGKIANEGEFDFQFETSEGNMEELIMQVAEVNKALGSISYLVDRGYRVVFDKDMVSGRDLSRMYCKRNGVTSMFRRERNIWILDAYVRHAAGSEASNGDGFSRRG